MSTSFPFLKIAREHNRTYGDVVRMSVDVANRMALGDDFDRGIEWNMTLDGPGPELLRAVVQANEAESARRALVLA